MVVLTIVCDRCSKEVITDLSGASTLTLSDQIRKEGFQYVTANKTDMLICSGCNNKFKELVGVQEEKAYREVCEFFDNCEGKDKNGTDGKTKND